MYTNNKQNLFDRNVSMFNFVSETIKQITRTLSQNYCLRIQKLTIMTTTDFNHIIAHQSDFLKPYAVSLTHDKEDANDLYQETMVRALVNKDKYREGTNIKAWLYTIMRNIFINTYRRNKKFTKVTSDVPEDIVMYNVDKKARNEGWGSVRMKEVKTAIENLPQVFRMSFELYYMGYKYQEIATLLDEPLGTIKSRIHFARKILTSKLAR